MRTRVDDVWPSTNNFYYLLDNAIAETKARHLEARLLENNIHIENLRSEREVLIRDHEQLQKRFTEINEVSATIRYRETIPLIYILSEPKSFVNVT